MMNSEYLLLTGALRVFDDFSSVNCNDFTVTHDTENPKFQELKNKYPIEKVAGSGDEFSKSVNLMRWVHKNVLHNGGRKDVEFVKKDSISILDYTFGKGVEYGVYCRLQAIVFTECCLAVGLSARTIHCLPFSPNDFDSHVVSMVYINEFNKWVLFDPGNNTYFTDAENNPLSPLEARKLLGEDNCFVKENLQPEYKQYMAKNLFYIKFSAVNTFGTDLVENQTTYHLVPMGFNVRDREIAYCEYAIKNSPENLRADWENALIGFRNQKIRAVSQEQFLYV